MFSEKALLCVMAAMPSVFGTNSHLFVDWNRACLNMPSGEAVCFSAGGFSGNVKALGSDSNNDPFLSEVLAPGRTHTCTMSTSGDVKCWGKNNFGQLGRGTDIFADGNPSDNAPIDFGDDWLEAVDVDSGSHFSCAIGTELELVPPTTTSSGSASSSSSSSSSSEEDDDEPLGVKCWGYNWRGQLGYGDTLNRGGSGTMGNNLSFVDLGDESYPMELSLGEAFGCALFANHKVKCWGSNGHGQLGIGNSATQHVGDEANEMGNNLPFVDLGIDVEQIATGEDHVCVLGTQGTVKCWGHNEFGQLGYGDTIDRGFSASDMGSNLPAVDLGVFVPVQIDAGRAHTCVVSADHVMKCWGFNNKGQLGIDNDETNRGDAANQMGGSLDAIDLGLTPDFEPVEVAAAEYYSCARNEQFEVKCWGNEATVGTSDLSDITYCVSNPVTLSPTQSPTPSP